MTTRQALRQAAQALGRKGGKAQAVGEPIRWDGCYDQQWRDLITAESFAHP